MIEKNKISKLSIKNLQSIKDLTVQDIENIINTAKLFKNNKSENINAEDLTLTDWIDHLSTIFTEVRLKTYIEMRGADAGSRFSLCALPAFWAGLIYCTECLDESISIIDKWDYQDILRFKIQIAKIGLDAEINNISGWDLAKQFINIS